MRILYGFFFKELKQTFRDVRMRFLLLGAPLVQLTLFGFAISNEIKNIRFGVSSPVSDADTISVVSALEASTWFHITPVDTTPAIAFKSLENSKVEGLLISSSQRQHYQLLVDGTDLLRARGIDRFINNIVSQTLLPKEFKQPSPLMEIKTLYNPALISSYQMVPGVMSMILTLFTVLLTSMSIGKEREQGTLEMLMVSPVKKWQLIAGKSIPYFILGLINMALILITAKIIFHIPTRGSMFWLWISSIFYLLTTVSIGIFISTIVKNQQQAMMGGFIFLFPAVMLSGVMTPISNMPIYLQWLAYINPLTYFANVLRNILLKGGSPNIIYSHIAALAIIGIIVFTISVLKFKKSL